MSRNKLLLYVSVTAVWVLVVVCSLIQEQANESPWYSAEEPEAGRVELENGLAAVVYGPLASGDTQVTLDYGQGRVSTIIPDEANVVSCRSVFPAGSKHVGATFAHDKRLDTLVLFNEEEALVFENVLAFDSDTGRVACLEINQNNGLNLTISKFDKTVLLRMEVPGHTAAFLQEPQVESAEFLGSRFLLRTVSGTVTVESPSCI